jgi:hypothetical protein
MEGTTRSAEKRARILYAVPTDKSTRHEKKGAKKVAKGKTRMEEKNE